VAVVFRETAPDVNELVAYVVPREESEVEPDQIREHLRSRLPEYMVPTWYIRLEELPLNANGKVDKRNLPEPDRGHPAHTGRHEEPASDTERQLAAIWADLLDRPQISRTDNFFDIGGNSLLAIQLQARIEKLLDAGFTVRDVFEFPRLESQSRKVDGTAPQASNMCSKCKDTEFIVPLRTDGLKSPFFFVTGAGDVIGIYGTLASLLDPDRPFYGFPDPMYTSLSTAAITVEFLAEAYLADIRVKQPQGPYLLGGYSLGGLVAYEMARRLMEDGEVVEKLIMLDAYPPPNRPGDSKRTIHYKIYRLRHLCGRTALLVRRWRSVVQDARIILGFLREKRQRNVETFGPEIRIRDYLRWSYLDMLRLDAQGEPEDSSYATRRSRLQMLQDSHYLTQYRATSVAVRAYHAYRFMPYRGSLQLVHAAQGGPAGGGFDETFGWGDFVQGNVDVHTVPGTHTSIFRQPDVLHLAHAIQRYLDESPV